MMSEASATFVPRREARQDDLLPRLDNPGRAFANGLLFAMPLWALIGIAIWAIA